jgi:N-acylneuraminate cytidylyltransferase
MYALLPMKAHSERIPDKNFKLLSGKPFFFYIADTLKVTGLFKNLVINTDSIKIISLALERYGPWVIIHDRPKNLQGDFIPMNSIIEYDIQLLGKDNDFMQTHSTNPFLSKETLINAADEYFQGKNNSELDSLFSVNAIKTRLYTKDIKPINHNPNILGRTQDLEVIYEENSNFYFFSGEAFLKKNHRIGIFPAVYEMNRRTIESLDIDEQSDWEFAKILINTGIR